MIFHYTKYRLKTQCFQTKKNALTRSPACQKPFDTLNRLLIREAESAFCDRAILKYATEDGDARPDA